jgi:hypothetical protein
MLLSMRIDTRTPATKTPTPITRMIGIKNLAAIRVLRVDQRAVRYLIA